MPMWGLWGSLTKLLHCKQWEKFRQSIALWFLLENGKGVPSNCTSLRFSKEMVLTTSSVMREAVAFGVRGPERQKQEAFASSSKEASWVGGPSNTISDPFQHHLWCLQHQLWYLQNSLSKNFYPPRLKSIKHSYNRKQWSGVWVAERARLLIGCARNYTEGSNPSHSVSAFFFQSFKEINLFLGSFLLCFV